MHRADFLTALTSAAAAIPLPGSITSTPREVAGVVIPDSALALDARAIALESEPIEIYYHSLRTFVFGELLARSRQLDHDVEAAYVAAILHDTGLSPKHMSKENRFEIDGANAAQDLLSRHGVSESRISAVWDAIAFHDSSFAAWKGEISQLVSDGVGLDFGANIEALRRDDVVAVLGALPRTNFIPVFLRAVSEIGRRKPFATGKCFVTDVAYRMVPGFHLANFCDQVKPDPLAAFAI